VVVTKGERSAIAATMWRLACRIGR
jgi:hypothetical protein